MLSSIARFSRAVLDGLINTISRVAAALASNRSIAVLTLIACAVLITGPWLRPPITRDLRGPHIPIGELTDSSFRPELTGETPRPWRWNSIAVPLLAVCLVGGVLVIARPGWTKHVFGLLLAFSLPAMAIAFWNYPTLIESFDSDLRDRALLRVVFRQHSEHMLAAGTPDRLATLGNKETRKDLLVMSEHPIWVPLRYSVYGMWLVGIALVATIVSGQGRWSERLGHAAVWTGAGLVLAAAATWPRIAAEYQFARAEAAENGNRFADAQHSLDEVRAAMPSMENTWRYWLANGRLRVRQQRTNDKFASFYLSHQAILNGDLTRARALLEPFVWRKDAGTAQRDLFAGIIAQQAAEYVAEGKYSAAELCWAEAATTAPWKPAYQIAAAAALLASSPVRAVAINDQITPLLSHVGDRMVASDVQSLVGDAHFVSGDFVSARQMYDLAIITFQTPKYINIPAQLGRLGM